MKKVCMLEGMRPDSESALKSVAIIVDRVHASSGLHGFIGLPGVCI